MKKFWDKYAPYWHICTAVLFAVFVSITWVNAVSAYGGRLDKLERGQAALQEIRFNLKNVANALGVSYVETVEEE